MNGLFNASDNFGHALARTHDLYLPDGPRSRRCRRLPSIFGGALKRSPDSTPDFAVGNGNRPCLRNWRTVDPKSGRPPGPLSLEAYMSALNMTGAEFAAIRRLFAVDAGEARETIRKRGCGPDSLRPYDIEPLDRSPLVSLEGRLYCPSVQLLRSKLTTGLHHVFLQPSEQNDRVSRDRYLAYAAVFSRTTSRRSSGASFPAQPGTMWTKRHSGEGFLPGRGRATA